MSNLRPARDASATTTTSTSTSTSTAVAANPDSPPLPRVLFAVTGFGPFAGVTNNPTQGVVEGLRRRASEGGEKGSPSPSPRFLSRSIVKADVLRVSAADVERWVRVDLEEAARWVAEEAERAEATAKAAEGTRAGSPSTSSTPPAPSSRPYHFVAVHLGVYASATSPKIRLETRAHNSADFRVPDADGRVLLRQAITATRGRWTPTSKARESAKEHKLESGLPLERVALRLSEESVPCSPSSSSPAPAWTVATTDDAGRYLCNFIYWHSLRACREAEERGEGERLVPLVRRLLLQRLAPAFGRRRNWRREGKAARVVRHAVFVHLPPAEVLPVGSQLDFAERLLRVLAEVLVERSGGGGMEEKA